ncbi:hypothetical protein OEZ86_006383 [Tetradesmus obliquus]|nr:hypothetical protein OEZ86_006383 [Tetradesmus obliquus]
MLLLGNAAALVAAPRLPFTEGLSMVKKLSLKEFYENGNTKPLIALLPTKPGDARDGDRTCYDNQHSRLADLSLDPRISRPQNQYSNQPVYGAGYGRGPSHAHVAPHYRGNQYYGGGRGPVGNGPHGDDDYHGSSNGSASNSPPYGGPLPSYGRGPYGATAPPGSGTGPAGSAAYPAAGPAGPGAPAAMGSSAAPSAHYGGGPYGGPPAGYGRGPNRAYAAAGDEEEVCSGGTMETTVPGGESAAKAASVKPAAATPFAAAPTSGPKNEFAERLAQKALANATRGKSSLLASGSASSLGSALSGSEALPPGAEDNACGDGAFVKPSHPFGRPRLVLKPRSVPAAAADSSRATTPSHHGRSGSSHLSEAAVARLGSTGSAANGRWGGGSNVSQGDDDWHTVHGRKGGAKGGAGSALIDDLDPFFGHTSAPSSKLIGGSSGHVSVPAPRAFERDIMRSSYRPYNNGNSHGKYGSSYDDDGYSGSYGKRSSAGAGGWGGRGGWGGEDDAEAEADGGVFRRALPTRQAPFAL